MVAATGSYVINDTMMKLATVGLPPYEVLFLRGVGASIWGIPLLFLMGYGKQLRLLADGRVLLRNSMETLAILCYVVALASMPIADVIALGQLTPLLVLLGSAALFRERIGAVRIVLIGLGFVGALLVAQPTLSGISIFALLALGNAVFGAARDISSRRVAPDVPGMIVAMSAVFVVMLAAGAMHLVLERWLTPDLPHLMLLLGAGLFLIFGHFFIFLAYRVGPVAAVAPFYYAFSVWAVISGLAVFGQLPDPLALTGIAVIVGSGLVVVALDQRRRRPAVTA
jgi:drug/metabolite transporter (DMT)-like permease